VTGIQVMQLLGVGQTPPGAPRQQLAVDCSRWTGNKAGPYTNLNLKMSKITEYISQLM